MCYDGGAPYASGLTGVDLFWRPVRGHEVFELGHLLIGNARENPGQPGFGVNLVHAAGLDESVGDPHFQFQDGKIPCRTTH